MNRFRPAIENKGGINPRLQQVLRGDERLIHVAHISAGIYWKGIAVLIFALLILLLGVPLNLSLYLVVVAIVLLIYAYMVRYNIVLALTDRQVLFRQGILTVDTVQIRFNRIESVELEWPPMGRLLGYSMVVLTGTGSRIAAIPFVADGPRFRQLLNDMLMAREDRIEGVAPAPVADAGT